LSEIHITFQSIHVFCGGYIYIKLNGYQQSKILKWAEVGSKAVDSPIKSNNCSYMLSFAQFGALPPFDFEAQMIYSQSHALKSHLNINSVIPYQRNNNRLRRIRKHNYDTNEVYKWLENAWNTERVLRFNSTIFQEHNSAFALQWAFPQAYYSVFCSLSSVFKTIGRTSQTHTSMIKEVNLMIKQGYYPDDVSFLADGGMRQITYIGISPPIKKMSSASYSERDQESIRNQICQFLKSTREIKLKERKEQIIQERNPNFRNKKGHMLKSFRQEHWEKISNMIGPTGIFDLLYRKRIKSNYKNVNVFQSNELRSKDINECLIHIVNYINMSNEIMLLKALGKNELRQLYARFLKDNKPDHLNQRKELVLTL
jgi:hypothetical protein